jgi:hypothetical protein
MHQEIKLRIVLYNPYPDVVYGIQKGKGNTYETVQKQKFVSGDLIFEIAVQAKLEKNNSFNFLGPFTQGNPMERFIYVDIGTTAGQTDSSWSRRLKIPLLGIAHHLTPDLDTINVFQTHVAGRGKDGTPNCGTVKPFEGWTLIPATK